MASNLRQFYFADGQVILVFYISCLDTEHETHLREHCQCKNPFPLKTLYKVRFQDIRLPIYVAWL